MIDYYICTSHGLLEIAKPPLEDLCPPTVALVLKFKIREKFLNVGGLFLLQPP